MLYSCEESKVIPNVLKIKIIKVVGVIIEIMNFVRNLKIKNINMIQRYKRTWCDYLIPCKINPNIMVGEYECSQCKFHKSMKENSGKKFEPGDYARYFYVYEGKVECNIE